MRIAIVSDVHGNYPALLAVINDAIENKVDHFLFVGDYIFDLPYPNEVT
ncbi:MAG: Calcineurin-like phosphoesterase superfamily domain, partial [Clostridia bacterium]|nr:Calcineurin-like phosphoesterase superfamily domain [Clostridia bacterium]